MRGVKVNVVLYRCIRKIKIEILPCGKAHCRPSAVSEGLPSGFLICWYDVGPRHRDGLPAVTGCLHPWLFLLSRAGWNPAGSKKDVAPRHLDLAPLGNRVPRRWIQCSLCQPHLISSGRRRWHGISRASATTGSPQAVAESGRICLPRRHRCRQTRLPASWQAITRSTRRSYGRRSTQYILKKPGHDVKTRRPAVERSGTRTRGGEYDARSNHQQSTHFHPARPLHLSTCTSNPYHLSWTSNGQAISAYRNGQ